jgi:hypothetical protein
MATDPCADWYGAALVRTGIRRTLQDGTDITPVAVATVRVCRSAGVLDVPGRGTPFAAEGLLTDG